MVVTQVLEDICQMKQLVVGPRTPRDSMQPHEPNGQIFFSLLLLAYNGLGILISFQTQPI